MRKICILLLGLTVAAASCQREFGNGGETPPSPSPVPADFDWKMAKSMNLTVEIPSVEGVAPDYAVVRVYGSATLTEANLVAMGVVKPASPTFRTSVSVPASVDNIYVQTTLPDGQTALRAVPAASNAVVSGIAMKKARTPGIELAADEKILSSMPAYYKMEAKSEADFPAEAVIRETPASMYDLGARYMEGSKGFAVAQEYYIPEGVEIKKNINLNGGQEPYKDPILYVAGKLTMPLLQIGNGATLVVLPTGEVTIGRTYATNAGEKERPAIYVFEGGRITSEVMELDCRNVVNEGEIKVDDEIIFGKKLSFVNAPGALLHADEVEFTGNSEGHNDGRIEAEEVKMNSGASFTNWENGRLVLEDCTIEAGNDFYQRGYAKIGDMECRGSLYVNCYTVIDELNAEHAKIYLAGNVALDVEEAEFNNTHVEMQPASMIVFKEYNEEGDGCNNRFDNDTKDEDGWCVVIIKEKAVIGQKATTTFSGPIEIVYDGKIGDKYLHDAVVCDEQTTVIRSTVCNGGKEPVVPEPEPEPDYIETAGGYYTLCFEDGWPWIGDYDMNDVVVGYNVDRRATKDGRIEFVRINWELKASGAAHNIAMAVQLDEVPAGMVASVETTNDAFGAGPFAASGQEEGNEYAVVPLFNSVQEVLPSTSTYINTSKDLPAVATTRHATTIRFTQPLDPAAVQEAVNMNFFIVVNSRKEATSERAKEIHMPGYRPTAFGKVTGYNTVTEQEPYKYFVTKGDGKVDNGMMWGLMIPGEFRYPAERKDIRIVYDYFNAWAASGGAVHGDWNEDSADEELIY